MSKYSMYATALTEIRKVSTDIHTHTHTHIYINFKIYGIKKKKKSESIKKALFKLFQ